MRKIQNWRTTVVGFSAALYSTLEPLMARGEIPDSKTLGFAVLIALLGWLSADSKNDR